MAASDAYAGGRVCTDATAAKGVRIEEVVSSITRTVDTGAGRVRAGGAGTA